MINKANKKSTRGEIRGMDNIHKIQNEYTRIMPDRALEPATRYISFANEKQALLGDRRLSDSFLF